MSNYRGTNGKPLTEALFWETNRDRKKYVPPYTLKDHDHQGSVSLKALYLAANDPTEYQFAMSTLGSWQHWKMLCRLDWFLPHITEWREELKLQLQAESVAEARRILADPDSSANAKLSAAKFVTGGEYKKKGAGRPSKGDVARAAREQAEEDARIENDWSRVGGLLK